MQRIVWMVFLAMVFGPGVSGAAGHRPPLPCGCEAWCTLMEVGTEWQHMVVQHTGGSCVAVGEGYHSEFLDGFCFGELHGACIPEQDGDEDLTSKLLSLETAVEAADVVSIQEAMASLAGVAVVNVERTSIQILGCDGWFLGNLPISTFVLNALVTSSLS